MRERGITTMSPINPSLTETYSPPVTSGGSRPTTQGGPRGQVGYVTATDDVLGYSRENLKLSEEMIPLHLDALADQVFAVILGIEKYRVEVFWLAPGFPTRVEKYLGQYVRLRKNLELQGEKHELGDLHQQIDQFYARLIGHKTTFTGAVIPLSKFRIADSWRKGSIESKYWSVVAALVMFAREKQEYETAQRQAANTARERWSQWIQDHSSNGPLVQFVTNITAKPDYWTAFSESWKDQFQHLPQYRVNSTGQKKDFNGDFNVATPETLHLLALQEGNKWMQINIYDNHQYIERGVRHMPPWVKIGWKQKIIEQLTKWRGNQDWETRINWKEWIKPK
jgi:hypothetical protein